MKKQLNTLSDGQIMELVGKFATQPVIIGLVGLAIVNRYPNIFTGGASTTTTTSVSGVAGGLSGGIHALSPLFDWLSKVLPGFGQIQNDLTLTTNTVVTSVTADVELLALKGALFLYIASGGNLAGVLTAAGGPLASALGPLLTGVTAAAAVP